MGFDVNRFESNVCEEFTCPICQDVLDKPLYIPTCEHVFCSNCINDWFKKEQICPLDRLPAQRSELKTPLRLFCSMLDNLKIRCQFESCNQYVKLGEHQHHIIHCKHNPDNRLKSIQCPENCGATIKMSDKHNCIQFLKQKIQDISNEKQTLMQNMQLDNQHKQAQIDDLQSTIQSLKLEINKYQNQIQLLKEEIETKNHILEFANTTNLPPLTSSPNVNLQKASLLNDGDQFKPDFHCSKQALIQLNDSLSDETSTNDKISHLNNSKFFVGNQQKGLLSSQLIHQKVPVDLQFNKMIGKVKNQVSFLNNMQTNETSQPDGQTVKQRPIVPPRRSFLTNNIPIIIEEHCTNANVKRALENVSRKHFYPNICDHDKIVSLRKNCHSFPFSYEIRLLQYIEPLLKPDSRVLDIGSGTGFLTCCLAQMCQFVIGVEHARELVAKSQDILENHYQELKVCFCRLDGRFGCEKYSPYDVILIEPFNRTSSIPEKIINQLKPNGYLIAVVKNENSRLQLIKMNRLQTIREVLCDDHQWLAQCHKDSLSDLNNQQVVKLSNILNIKT